MPPDDLPLLHHLLDAPPTLTPEGLLDAVRVARGLPREPVPDVCVLEFDGDLTDWLVSTGAARPSESWACFHTTLYRVERSGAVFGIVPRTIGGPYAVLIAEQLKASGARVVLGLTSAGRVRRSLPLPSVVVATEAIRDEGTSLHYVPPSPTVSANAALAESLAAGLGAVGFPVSRGLVWTTDAPYRETEGQLARHEREGALAVEMQAASLFAFAIARRMPVGLIALVTNAAGHDEDPFEKGSHERAARLLDAMCRAAAGFLGRG